MSKFTVRVVSSKKELSPREVEVKAKQFNTTFTEVASRYFTNKYLSTKKESPFH
jgi:hypothetical protein